MILFSNPGLIDLDAALVMGVDAKTDETAIGFFGTGLKFSIATLLRNDCTVMIYRGNERFGFKTVDLNTRGKTFQQVYLIDFADSSSRPLGFTTDLGKNWKPWQAYRELYSNAKDEGGRVSRDSETYILDLAVHGDVTVVAVLGKPIEEAYDNRGKYILEGEPDVIAEGVASAYLHHPADAGLFYRGIFAKECSPGYRYTYNLLGWCTLTEDRTLAHDFQIHQYIAGLTDKIAADGDFELFKSILCEKTFAEKDVKYGGPFDNEERSPEWLAFAETLVKSNLLDLNESALKTWQRLSKGLKDTLEPLALTNVQEQMLKKAIVFCHKLGFKVDTYPIVPVTSIGERGFGLAYKGHIYIATFAFEKGTREVAATLIEEFIHLSTGYGDFTREFQNHVLNQLVRLGEEHVTQEPL